jgi:predicted DNA-binding antitoxin AbrB/MazE fold protein
MTRHQKAVYEDGVLRPLEGLPLREKEIVTVTVTSNGDVPEQLVDSEFLSECEAEADESVALDQVRTALAKIPGSMAEHITRERDDRV